MTLCTNDLEDRSGNSRRAEHIRNVFWIILLSLEFTSIYFLIFPLPIIFGYLHSLFSSLIQGQINIIGFNTVVHRTMSSNHSKQLFEDMLEACYGPYVHFLFLSTAGTFICRWITNLRMPLCGLCFQFANFKAKSQKF